MQDEYNKILNYGCGRKLSIFIPEIELNQSDANKTIIKLPF